MISIEKMFLRKTYSKRCFQERKIRNCQEKLCKFCVTAESDWKRHRSSKNVFKKTQKTRKNFDFKHCTFYVKSKKRYLSWHIRKTYRQENLWRVLGCFFKVKVDKIFCTGCKLFINENSFGPHWSTKEQNFTNEERWRYDFESEMRMSIFSKFIRQFALSQKRYITGKEYTSSEQ